MSKYYRAYTNVVINLPMQYSKYYTFETKYRNGSSKRGLKSKYEQMMPEFIPLIVAYAVANTLYNSRASYFRLQVILYALPFFLNNAPKEEQDKIDFVRNVRPLLDEREHQIQQTQYMEMQYQNYIRSLYYFNQNMYYQGLRPVIPGDNTNFSGMAYMMPSPKEIQKHLDSQPKYLKEVVRFEDPNKNK